MRECQEQQEQARAATEAARQLEGEAAEEAAAAAAKQAAEAPAPTDRPARRARPGRWRPRTYIAAGAPPAHPESPDRRFIVARDGC